MFLVRKKENNLVCVCFFLFISNPNQSYSLCRSLSNGLGHLLNIKLEPIFIVTLLPSFFLLQCKKNMQIIKQIDKNLLLLKPTPSDWTKPKKKKTLNENNFWPPTTYHVLYMQNTHTHTHTQIDSSRFIQIIIIKTNDQDQTNHEQQQQQMTTKTLNIV